MAASSDPLATADPGSAEAGGARRLRLDEMLAERARPPLPPAPVLTVEPVAVDAASTAGFRGTKKRLAEVEALARRNLRAAEEARRIVLEERELLEQEASARTRAEVTAAGLRREVERLRSTEEQRAAQARFAATHEARAELAIEIERVHDEHAQVVDELDRMRGTLFDHDSLLDEYSRRLRDEQDAQTKARAEQVRAEEALRVVERNLEIATETARRRAEEDQARFTKVEDAWRDACVERDRVTAELHRLTTGDGELARLTAELDATREDQTRLLADLDVQAVRAATAESELATAREKLDRAERIAADATEARDLAGISLETTRSELAEKAEALDAERSTAQARIADLVAQLSTATRTAEHATERSADLESRLDAAIAARDDAVTRAETLSEQAARAQADTDQLRTQAASIGDELAATQAALEQAREEASRASDEARRASEEARRASDEARRSEERARAAEQAAAAAPSTPLVDPASSPTNGSSHASANGSANGSAVAAPIAEPSEPAPSSFDAALASAFGQEPSGAEPVDEMPLEGAPKSKGKSKSKFRIAEPDPDRVRAPRAGGPVVDLELSLARGIEPIEAPPVEDPADGTEANAEPERAPETETWRRTAMAELTALASDSDDLTPRRRR